MEKRKVKMGLSAMMIVAIVFMGLGIGFLPAGIAAFVMDWNVEGDLVVFASVFVGIGTLFLFLGILFLSLEIRKRNVCNRLLQDGYYITAEVVSVDMNYAVQYGNHGHPYIVRCSYTDYNGTLHIFKSRNITRYPGNDLEGQMVKVYLDRNAPENYKNYYVDVDEILQNVVEH